jgi:YcxB-like protein
MLIRFAITPDILRGAQVAAMRHVKWMRVGLIMILVVFPLLMVAIGLLAGRSVLETFRTNALLLIGLPLFWIVGMPLITRWSSKRMWHTTPMFQGEHAYTFGSEGFELVTPVSRTAMAWASVVKAVETRDYVLLFINKMAAQFIPKSAFKGPSELDDFRALVSRALGSRAQWSDERKVVAAAR